MLIHNAPWEHLVKPWEKILIWKHNPYSTLRKGIALKVCLRVTHFYITQSTMTHYCVINADSLLQNEARTRPEMKSSPIFLARNSAPTNYFVLISRPEFFTDINFVSALSVTFLAYVYNLTKDRNFDLDHAALPQGESSKFSPLMHGGGSRARQGTLLTNMRTTTSQPLCM